MLLHSVKHMMLKRAVDSKLFKIINCGYNIFMREQVKPRGQLRYITQEMLHRDRTVIHKPSPTKFRPKTGMNIHFHYISLRTHFVQLVGYPM